MFCFRWRFFMAFFTFLFRKHKVGNMLRGFLLFVIFLRIFFLSVLANNDRPANVLEKHFQCVILSSWFFFRPSRFLLRFRLFCTRFLLNFYVISGILLRYTLCILPYFFHFYFVSTHIQCPFIHPGQTEKTLLVC